MVAAEIASAGGIGHTRTWLTKHRMMCIMAIRHSMWRSAKLRFTIQELQIYVQISQSHHTMAVMIDCELENKMDGEIEYNPVILAALHGNKQNYPEALAKTYPRIFDKIVELWGSPECDSYIRELMVDDRGTRQGFSPTVGYDILYLGMVHTVVAADERAAMKDAERKAFSWKKLFFGKG